jgi:hypothetical protein
VDRAEYLEECLFDTQNQLDFLLSKNQFELAAGLTRLCQGLEQELEILSQGSEIYEAWLDSR